MNINVFQPFSFSGSRCMPDATITIRKLAEGWDGGWGVFWTSDAVKVHGYLRFEPCT